jgi:hypothetical protein
MGIIVTRSGCNISVLLLLIAGLSAADVPIPERTATFTLDSNLFAAEPPPGTAGFPGVGVVKRWVKKVTHTLTDQIRDTLGSVTSITNNVGQVLSETVRLSGAIPVKVRTSLSNAFDHRPEWFVDPPYWLELTCRSCVGVSFTSVNNLISLEQAVADGKWSDADKALLINACIHEGVMTASNAAQNSVTVGTAGVPVIGLVINVGVAYGFDRIEDELTDRVSQHFRTETSPGSVQAAALKAANAPILLTLKDGVVVPAVTVANAVILGGASNGNFTVVTSNDSNGAPSYFVASQGGMIVILSNTVIVGEVMLQVATSAYLPSEASQRARDLTQAAETAIEWVDNVATPNGTAN